MKRQKKVNGLVGLVVSFRLMISVPVLIVSCILMYAERVVLAFAGLFIVTVIIVVSRVILDDRFDRRKVERKAEEDAD